MNCVIHTNKCKSKGIQKQNYSKQKQTITINNMHYLHTGCPSKNDPVADCSSRQLDHFYWDTLYITIAQFFKVKTIHLNYTLRIDNFF